jgi:putative ATP-dependent endonuclease of OLD family
MIQKVVIKGYRTIKNLTLVPHPRFNLLVGDNESGKSTLLEAIGLALTGRVNGRSASDELNPYWFNQESVSEFFAARQAGAPSTAPEISIEVFLIDLPEFQRNLVGAHNSASPTRSCAGVTLRVVANPEYDTEIEEHFKSPTKILPVEYFKVEWRSFGDLILTARPREITTALIDSRTIRSTGGVDFHLRQILNDHLDAEEKSRISLAFRAVKETMTNDHFPAVNEKMANLEGPLDNQRISLAMDQSSRASWDSNVVPHVAEIPFGMAGQGQQAVVKIALAMGHEATGARVVMIEEPENHLSHTSLNKLLSRIQLLAGSDQQLFIATHSSFVLNRMGLDNLVFMSKGNVAAMSDISENTVDYFKKLPGYDTLRMVLAERFVLVEGPSDEIVFEKFYKDSHDGRRPIESGIDVISMGGLSLKRCLELAKALRKTCAVLRDNDGNEPESLIEALGELYDPNFRRVFVGDVATGKTLETQILDANPDHALMRRVLGRSDRAELSTWMSNNKTEAALAIFATSECLNSPPYIAKAIEFIDAGN